MAARTYRELHHLYYILAKRFSRFCLCPEGLLETEVIFLFVFTIIITIISLCVYVLVCMCVHI